MKADKQKLTLTMLGLSVAVLVVACVYLFLRKPAQEQPEGGMNPAIEADTPGEEVAQSLEQVKEEKSEAAAPRPALEPRPTILPEPTAPGTVPVEVIKALEYQPEYLPAGYSLSGESDGGIASPGYVPDFKLEEFAKELGTEIPLKKAYVCKFKGEQAITYMVLVPENGDKAPELKDALASGYAGQKDAYASVFSLGISVVAVTGTAESAAAIDELSGKLKKAIGYD